MASPSLTACIKSRAHYLTQALNAANYPLKHTQALEFVSRNLYGYPSWNNATGNSSDLNTKSEYQDCLSQVAALIEFNSSMSINNDDLLINKAGVPKIARIDLFHPAANAVAAAHLMTEHDNLLWYDFVADQFIPANAFDHYPESMRPTSSYDQFQFYRLNLEWKHRPLSKPGHYEWDLWEKRMKSNSSVNEELIHLARSVYREAIQHSWDLSLQVFLGPMDEGRCLTRLVEDFPEEIERVLESLLSNDGTYTSLD